MMDRHLSAKFGVNPPDGFRENGFYRRTDERARGMKIALLYYWRLRTVTHTSSPYIQKAGEIGHVHCIGANSYTDGPSTVSYVGVSFTDIGQIHFKSCIYFPTITE